jgi:uncharacterized protein (DUF885 family)
MKRACLALVLLFIARPLAESSGQPETEDAKLQKYFKEYLDAEFKLRPTFATRSGNHDYDDRLDDVSPKARKVRTICNAILDYKMHCTDISDADAIRFVILRALQSEAEAILKILRAKQSSCQLSTYFVGRLAFQRLRRDVQNELGERFDLGRFHEAAPDHGSLPVKYLPEVTRERLKRER